MKNQKGLNTHRFKDHPDEKAFAEKWQKLQVDGKYLAHLLDNRPVQTGHPPTPTDRDFVVAATVIQWLGSPVGQLFLNDCGFEKKEIPCKLPPAKRRAKS